MRGVAHDPVFRAKLMALHEQGVSLTALSAEFEVAREVLGRWWARYQAGDLAALQPLSRCPRSSPTKLRAEVVRRILALRVRRYSAVRIGHLLDIGHSTVQRVLEQHGLNQLSRPARPHGRRYEKSRPGELLHLDLKFLPALRNARHDFEFAAIDDFSREAVVRIQTDQTSAAAAAFLEHVVATLPYRVEAVLTDNAFAFTMRHAHHSDRLTRFQQACQALAIRHYVVRPYTPQSNGKVERFFRTVDDECLYVQPLFTFGARSRAVDRFVWYYNHERPHQSLHGMTPVARRTLYFKQAG
jgi:transposase InsO family protein